MAGVKWPAFCRPRCRRKVFPPDQIEDGNLRRCLNRWDLTALGVGSATGAGIYVLIGYVALNVAGPSVVLSFLMAAVAALFAGLCYAEFATRVPRAGSAYIYTYVAIGELMAFLIGWCNILEAAVGAASLSSGLSLYLDSMVNGSMTAWYESAMPLGVPLMSPYFNLLAFLIILCVGVLLSVGVRESAYVNNVLVGVNIIVIAFIIVAGAICADVNNWYIPLTDVPEGSGSGGFFPYGVWGTMQGVAVCFYGFVGFDTVNAVAEEVHRPRRTIPFTILIVLLVAFLVYSSVSIVVTMMVPYYLQDRMYAVTSAFGYVGWNWARWIVFFGAIFGILSNIIGALLPLPRLLYAMASDGLLFSFFAKLTPSRKSPALATALSAVIISVLAGILDLETLILMMCLGTLFSYTIVAISVVVLRYHSSYAPKSSPGFFKELFGCGFRLPTKGTERIVEVSLALFIAASVSSALVITHANSPLIPVVIIHALVILLVVIMMLQPRAKEEVSFKTPLVPLIPCLSIYVNVHLMVLIKLQTWICVAVWILIGIPIYIICICCYKRKDIVEDKTTARHENKNGTPPVQIVVESPTPPDTMNRISTYGGDDTIEEMDNETEGSVRGLTMLAKRASEPPKTEEITIHQAYVENNEEKEAKIIDLLDQVLQAEEDTYGEVISLQDQKEDIPVRNEVQRKSISELSDAGSDASLGNQGLSKYDVIAQVHREDLPRVNEEEERREDEDDEQVTAFNDSETNSRTDESGYSDTLDSRNTLSENVEGKEDAPYIPVPPPLDENFFRSPHFKKSYTISARPTKKEGEEEEEEKPRSSVNSNNSQEEDNITFGSDRQIHFMSKLNNLFQNKISGSDDDEPRKRSHSTGNVTEGTEFSPIKERKSLFLDLQKEIISREAAQNLKPVNSEDTNSVEEEPEEDTSMSRQDLKSKLENIFATGGPNLLKPRLMKSNPPTPEEAYQTDTSSTESIAKLPKVDKNDTLKRQKAKFGEVLNSFRLSMNKDDEV
ncbi:hypothetical protein O3G_MSEX005918 [Manduca sexta]|uniref:Cationic amino acid transporter C-terminal domain-containing protein n=1 Tax=Manduca sexta TaxID=7130 RepID=A0A921Z1R6_MANSE|nr:hypothetical protein O3G_MSEX005918 [Manduca sexta]KAG6449186.1 hypothetical protein O3G_MSEX005918 [Manduca sexta]